MQSLKAMVLIVISTFHIWELKRLTQRLRSCRGLKCVLPKCISWSLNPPMWWRCLEMGPLEMEVRLGLDEVMRLGTHIEISTLTRRDTRKFSVSLSSGGRERERERRKLTAAYKPREGASEWNLTCQHLDFGLPSLLGSPNFCCISHTVNGILLWQLSRLMQSGILPYSKSARRLTSFLRPGSPCKGKSPKSVWKLR